MGVLSPGPGPRLRPSTGGSARASTCWCWCPSPALCSCSLGPSSRCTGAPAHGQKPSARACHGPRPWTLRWCEGVQSHPMRAFTYSPGAASPVSTSASLGSCLEDRWQGGRVGALGAEPAECHWGLSSCMTVWPSLGKGWAVCVLRDLLLPLEQKKRTEKGGARPVVIWGCYGYGGRTPTWLGLAPYVGSKTTLPGQRLGVPTCPFQ